VPSQNPLSTSPTCAHQTHKQSVIHPPHFFILKAKRKDTRPSQSIRAINRPCSVSQKSSKSLPLTTFTHKNIVPPMFPEIFMMMDSTDFEEHVLLSALDDDPVDDYHGNGVCNIDNMSSQKQPRPLSTKTLSGVSAATAETAMMDEEDIDSFFFDDVHDQGIEMVIDEDAKPPARVLEEAMPSKKSSSSSASRRSSSTKKKNSKTSSTSCKKNEEEAPVRVGMPGKFDVLCGQSRICASHTGNRRFQVVLDIFAPRYDAATSKQEKMTMTKEIVASIQQAGGRFLKYKDGQWEEISDVTARDKTSHALRTKVTSWKRQQQESKKEGASRRSSTTPSRATHRRAGSQRSRRSSGSSIGSDIVATSFDGNDSSSANVMSELIKAQKQFFAKMTSPESGAHPLKKSA
jgi:hypothetical protein